MSTSLRVLSCFRQNNLLRHVEWRTAVRACPNEPTPQNRARSPQLRAGCGAPAAKPSNKTPGNKIPQTGELPGFRDRPASRLLNSKAGATEAPMQRHSHILPALFRSLPLPVAGRRMRQQPCSSSNPHSRNPRNHHQGTSACSGAAPHIFRLSRTPLD
jgi:hypothetical protein